MRREGGGGKLCGNTCFGSALTHQKAKTISEFDAQILVANVTANAALPRGVGGGGGWSGKDKSRFACVCVCYELGTLQVQLINRLTR